MQTRNKLKLLHRELSLEIAYEGKYWNISSTEKSVFIYFMTLLQCFKARTQIESLYGLA